MPHKSKCKHSLCCVRGVPGQPGLPGQVGLPGQGGSQGATGEVGLPGPQGDAGPAGSQAQPVTGLSETTEWIVTSGTWPVPTGVFSATITAVGGGGGGGQQTTGINGGQGGGGGGMAKATILVEPGQEFTITIQAGGGITAGAGVNGGDVSFQNSDILIQATGGEGGKINTLDTPAQGGTGFVTLPSPLVVSQMTSNGQTSAGSRGGSPPFLGYGGFIPRTPGSGNSEYASIQLLSSGGVAFGGGGAGSLSFVSFPAPPTTGAGGVVIISYVIQS